MGARISIGLLAGLAVLASWSCMAIVDPDVGALGHPPAACEPATQIECTCQTQFGTVSGKQTCNAGGGYDDCVCVSNMPTAGAGGGNKGKGSDSSGKN